MTECSDEYPPVSIRVYVSNALKMCQPHSRYCSSCTRHTPHHHTTCHPPQSAGTGRTDSPPSPAAAGCARPPGGCPGPAARHVTPHHITPQHITHHYTHHATHLSAVGIGAEVRNLRAQPRRHLPVHLIARVQQVLCRSQPHTARHGMPWPAACGCRRGPARWPRPAPATPAGSTPDGPALHQRRLHCCAAHHLVAVAPALNLRNERQLARLRLLCQA